ncbi:DUF5707 domain-containing protein [Streptomyces sp. ID05-04B]|uniref:DUF5707 domain-containing protein n=1 Tax=unclassified Streptomyces TaxID=2593676 RepID=UPI000D1BC7BF|nr:MULTISPECIES: DUF5707 domain-containing protein [unclassified Streptomyces]AVV46981.1 hypothetical protein C6376_42315 [Streptomyces sp. P3]MDX5570488.1 DUF5707 domain-containing protein [Streptomyces sp. ID05-04B]
MTRGMALSVAAGTVVLVSAGAYALAYAGEQPPALTHATARYSAPDGGRDGSLTFATFVTAPSGVKGVKVLAWPQNSSLAGAEPTAEDMAAAEPALCKPYKRHTVSCTYTVRATSREVAASPHGVWHVAVLATARNGTTTLKTQAAHYTVK